MRFKAKIAVALGVLIAVSSAGVARNFKGFEPTTGPWTPPTRAAVAKPILPREPCNAHFRERQALFGDLHIHTGVSMDANSLGTRTTPSDAYRYARGETIGS